MSIHNTVSPFETPILLMVFNRIETTKEVFNAIKRLYPKKLYISSDGPRKNRPEDEDKVLAIREFITSNVTWPCQVATLYQPSNLGCKEAVSEGISWFFENEEQGIILEDDCVPSESFFFFCNELLGKYRDDERVWQIAGFNLLGNEYQYPHSYFFTHFGFAWGWATWRRAWKSFDRNMRLWPQAKTEILMGEYPFTSNRIKIWEGTYHGKIDTWDYQWSFAMAINSGLSVVPVQNLVKNIGFTADATHTILDTNGRSKVKSGEIELPLKHPSFIIDNYDYGRRLLARVEQETSFSGKAIRKLKKIFRI